MRSVRHGRCRGWQRRRLRSGDPAGVAAAQSGATSAVPSAGSSSNSFSAGRQILAPCGATTIGRSIRIGCASIASRSASSLSVRSARQSASLRRSLATQDITRRRAHACKKIAQRRARRRRPQIFDHNGFDPGLPEEPKDLARCAALRIVVDCGLHVPSLGQLCLFSKPGTYRPMVRKLPEGTSADLVKARQPDKQGVKYVDNS